MSATVTKRSQAELCRDYLALRDKGKECYQDASAILEELIESGMESGDQVKLKGKNGGTETYALLDDWEGKNDIWVGRYATRYAVVKL